MMKPYPSATLLLLCLSGVVPNEASATEPTTVRAENEDGVETRVELRSEYIHGEPILVPINLVNPSASRITIPDLASRPWLVEFQLVLPTGNDQLRRNTPPETDTEAVLNIAPRGQRRFLLEVPMSAGMRSGDYRMEIRIRFPEETVTLPSHEFSLVSANPIESDLSPQQHPGSQTESLNSLWVHRAAESFDLYLHQASGRNPATVQSDLFLAHLDSRRAPILATARSRESANAHVVWMTGPRTLRVMRLAGSSTPESPTRLELPWPRIELEARGITSSTGELHLPIWVPAPRGSGGTMQLVRFDNRNQPRFERIGHFTQRPDLSLSMIDDAGQPHLLLVHSGNLDRYSPRQSTPEGHTFPVPGSRMMRSRTGHRVIDIQVVPLPDSDRGTGTLAVLLTSLHEGQVHHRWLNMSGSVLQEEGGVAISEEHTVIGVVPNAWETPSIAVRNAEDEALLLDGELEHFIELEGNGSWQLYRSNDGRVHLRQARSNGPIHQHIVRSP